ncbi:MAG: PQQ-binding-like beta-propeller repeat protein [Planctomycetes bacterium]|nr:PQQ-binding-like beta-propeller repeat protein [Planctomycetota bacterium]
MTNRKIRPALLAFGLAALVLALSGCDEDDDGGAARPKQEKPPKEAKAEKPKKPKDGGEKVPAKPTAVTGWLDWRGPHHNGTSDEVNLPETWAPGGANHLWTADLPGRGTPVIADGRLYVLGYSGEGADLQEYLACVDPESGKVKWERRFNDFLSDIVYNRYSIGAPAIDPETGNVYILTSPGLFICFDRNGKELWQHSLMETFGRLTFPNGRTGAPIVEGNLVIVRGITAFWGSQGPARDRFYAYDKRSGEHIWASTPGVGPQDSSWAHPLAAWWQGRRVLYVGTGCGNVACIDVATGDPLWRYRMSLGGINAQPVLFGNSVIAVHDKENVDNSKNGGMLALKLPNEIPLGKEETVLAKDQILWRNDLSTFSSSPVPVGGRLYVTTMTGELACVEMASGKVLWNHKLGTEQLHASPLYADGKLYIPMLDGGFHIVKPTDTGAQVLSTCKLEGAPLGAPAIWNGKVYVQTTKHLYCFGRKGKGTFKPLPHSPWEEAPAKKETGPGQLQVVPSEVLLKPGETVKLHFRRSDLNVPAVKVAGAWQPFVPATAKVKAMLGATFADPYTLTADEANVPGAGMFKFTSADGKETAFLRGRILQKFPIEQDFEAFKLGEKAKDGPDFAYPPLPWIGARFKWEIQDLEGNKVLAKTLDNLLFQRSLSFIGHPDMSNYTMEVDVYSDGNRRIMSSGGVIHQRYIIALVGSSQILEVSSNYDRIKVSVPFTWAAKTWYTLKTRVDVAADGSGVVRGKAWKKGDPEPEKWTIEVPHKVAHAHGSPGLYGFSPQSLKRVYLDNVKVYPSK